MCITLGYHLIKSLVGKQTPNQHHYKPLERENSAKVSTLNSPVEPLNTEVFNSHYRFLNNEPLPNSNYSHFNDFNRKKGSENEELKISNSLHSEFYGQYLNTDWLENASWTQILIVIFILSLSFAVFVSLCELSFRYFRYIKYNITYMDETVVNWKKSDTMQNLKKVSFLID